MLFFPASIFGLKVEAQNPNILQGRVFDIETQTGIADATIQVWDTSLASQISWRLMRIGKTDSNGYYSMAFNTTFRCRVYAFYDNVSSPGFDYVPAFWNSQISGVANATFGLEPAASVIVDGSIRFIESDRPSDNVRFIVSIPNENSVIGQAGNVRGYGSKLQVHDFLGLDANCVIVPLETPITIFVNASVSTENGYVHRAFILSAAEYAASNKGVKLNVKVDESLFQFNSQVVRNKIDLTEKSLGEVEQNGFYITLERQDLAQIKQLDAKASMEATVFAYDAAYADLREAYFRTIDVSRRIVEMYGSAMSSIAILAVFVVLTVLALSLTIFEKRISRILAIIGLSGFLFVGLYFTYPGVRLLSIYSFLSYVFGTLVIALIAYFLIPRFADPRFISVFSLGRQNLKRRKLRFILTLISVIVLSMSFVTFTSFSTGYGLTSNSYNAGISPEGLLVRRPLKSVISATVTFVPLETSTIAWLQNKPDVLVIAPKFENYPTFFPVGTISPSANPLKTFDIFGVLGIQPSAEANITHMDDLVIGGSYITDLNQNEILITRQASESLSLNVGDELLLDTGVLEARLTLVGILDDVRFSQMRDIDLTPLLPQKIVETTSAPGSPPTILVERCQAAEVIVMNYEAAKEVFAAISLSRIDVKLQSPNSADLLSRQIALERDLSVWYSFAGTANQVVLGGYTEAKGLSVMIPWIIVMVNVIVTMLNSMFERRKEIGILSSIGLNPSHIAGIFMAEAAIIGIVGGGVGYLLGLSSYRGLLLLSVLVEVREKVSAVWSFASLGVAVVAVLVGTGIALRSSVIITPSALRKWTGESNVVERSGRLEFRMPIRLHEDGVSALFTHLKEVIPNHIVVAFPAVDIDSVKRRATETQVLDNDTKTKTLLFNYFFGQADFIGSSPFSLVAVKQKGEDTYSLTLICTNADKETIERKVTFIRMKIVDWDAQRR